MSNTSINTTGATFGTDTWLLAQLDWDGTTLGAKLNDTRVTGAMSSMFAGAGSIFLGGTNSRIDFGDVLFFTKMPSPAVISLVRRYLIQKHRISALP